MGRGVGAGEGSGVGRVLGAGVGRGVGAGDGAVVGCSDSDGRGVENGAGVGQPPCVTPHDVDTHEVYEVPSKASSRSTSSATHQPRSWLKAEAHEIQMDVR